MFRKTIASFLIVCLGIVGVDVGFNESRASLKAVAGFNQAAVAITGGSITGVSGVPYVWKSYHIPIIIAPTGTMANNGAVTLGTALGTTYANCYLVVPAGAIAAGVPAA